MRRRYRDFSAAEDAVQEALIAAATQWPTAGVPDSPRAWLIQVATRRLTDEVRAAYARQQREEHVVSLVPGVTDDEEDDSLELLFLCCDPSLSPSSAIALLLRAVGGLTTLEIARAFMVPEATMAQRISRAKATVEKVKSPPKELSAEQRAERLGSVMHVLYLIFNEGYTASGGEELLRTDLSQEALRLARMLRRLVPTDGEAAGLLALMLLTDARRVARTGPHGELIPLDQQDRSKWDRAQISEGSALVEASFRRGAVGPYQLQAAIAAVHDAAPSTDETDWEDIAGLYGVLLRLSDNPMVALNHAIAVAMVSGPAAGLERVEAIADRLKGHHRLHAVRAHLLERKGDREGAVREYRRAAELTASIAERNYLLEQAARLDA